MIFVIIVQVAQKNDCRSEVFEFLPLLNHCDVRDFLVELHQSGVGLFVTKSLCASLKWRLVFPCLVKPKFIIAYNCLQDPIIEHGKTHVTITLQKDTLEKTVKLILPPNCYPTVEWVMVGPTLRCSIYSSLHAYSFIANRICSC